MEKEFMTKQTLRVMRKGDLINITQGQLFNQTEKNLKLYSFPIHQHKNELQLNT